MKRIVLCCIAIIATVCLEYLSSSEAAFYQWVDEKGIEHYSDVPPEIGQATVLEIQKPCELKRQMDEKETLEQVVILGAYLGGLDASNRALARKRLSDKYRSLVIPLHDLEEYCKGGDQIACACLSSMANKPHTRGLPPGWKDLLPSLPRETLRGRGTR